MIEGAIQRAEYSIRGDETDILMWIRTEEGDRRKIRVKSPFHPYFYTTEEASEDDDESIVRVQKTEKKRLYSRDPVWKVETETPSDVGRVRGNYKSHSEADILFPQRYLIDSSLKYGIRITDDGRIVPTDSGVEPKVMYIDIEVFGGESVDRVEEAPGEVFLIGAYLANERKERQFILSHSDVEYSDERIECQTEEEVFKKFIDFVKEVDPDILIGKYITNFDLPYLYHRAKRINRREDETSFDFSEISPLGRVKERSNDFVVYGRDALDWGEYYQKKKNEELESFRLHDILENELRWEPIEIDDFEKCWEENPERVIERNDHDIRGPAVISEARNVLPFFNELRKLVGCRFEDTRFLGKLVDYYYLRKLSDTQWVAPSKRGKKGKKFPGAAVLEPKRGRWESVQVLDIDSAYPSIMRSFNISPETLIPKSMKDEVPHKKLYDAYFRDDKKGIIPRIQEEFLEKRNRKKREMKEATGQRKESLYLEQYAIKALGNSIYGSLGERGSRYFRYNLAKSITTAEKEIIEHTANVFEEKGYPVVFGDTDSVALVSEQDSEKLVKIANSTIEEFMSEKFGIEEHQMSMSLDKIFEAIVIKEKKLYAGKLQSGELEKKGIASRRSDTAPLTKRLQERVLEKILDGVSREEIRRDVNVVVSDIKGGEYGVDELGVPTRFKKKPDAYDISDVRYKMARRAKKYQDLEIERGDKPKKVVCKVIGMTVGWNDNDLQDLEIDYKEMIRRYVRPKLETYLNLYDIDWEDAVVGQTTL